LENKNTEEKLKEIVERDTSSLVNTTFNCICGKTHKIAIKYISIKEGAVKDVRDTLYKLGITGKGAAIYDKKIEKDVVNPVLNQLKKDGLDLTHYPVGDGEKLIPPEIDLSLKIAESIKDSTDYLISVGSGVISDLTKNAAQILELPYILIATAPSMNGYTSSMAALAENGIKKTLLVNPASAIFADLNILMEAPISMVRSGLGDIVSKSVCNADWKLSEIIKQTYFCPLPFRMTDKTEPVYLKAAHDIGEKTNYGIEVLTDSIMRSGLSMTVIGVSTPSSGAEHLLSHYWDLMVLMEGKKKHFHGVQVGVTTVIILKLYDFIRNYKIKKISLKSLKDNYPSREYYEGYIENRFDNYSDEVKKEFFKKYMDWKEKKKKEIEFIIDCWYNIWDELDPYIRPYQPVVNALNESGSAISYRDLDKTKAEASDTVINARFIRGRYTILDMASDLNLLKEAVPIVI